MHLFMVKWQGKYMGGSDRFPGMAFGPKNKGWVIEGEVDAEGYISSFLNSFDWEDLGMKVPDDIILEELPLELIHSGTEDEMRRLYGPWMLCISYLYDCDCNGQKYYLYVGENITHIYRLK